jgi:hypothetical protein
MKRELGWGGDFGEKQKVVLVFYPPLRSVKAVLSHARHRLMKEQVHGL